MKARSGLLLLVALTLSGCAVGPDFKTPAPPVATRYSPLPMVTETDGIGPNHEGAQVLVAGRDIPAEWWTVFHSPGLDSLIKRAFLASPSVASAEAALHQAQELVYAQEGAFFPTVQLGYTPTRQKLAGNLGGNAPGLQGSGAVIAAAQNPKGPNYTEPVIYNFHTAQLSIDYVPDVFGGNRRQVESLAAQQEVQRFQLEATYLSLAGNIVAAAIAEASLRDQIRATNMAIKANTDALDILRHQQRVGYAMDMDVALQAAATEQLKATLPPLQKSFEQTRDQLRALAGALPDEELPETFELSALTLPHEVPVSLPARLVEQRPDVKAAEAQLHSATADVGVAKAARLPQFDITGAIGGEAATFSRMFSAGGPFWNLAAPVTQTLFDGNMLLHKQRAAEDAMVEAAAQYRSVVVLACQNVADTLHALTTDATELDATTAAEAAAKVSLDVVTTQNRVGYANDLALINAETTYQQVALTRIQAEASRLADTAALFQALGGGWWNRPPDDSNQPAGPR